MLLGQTSRHGTFLEFPFQTCDGAHNRSIVATWNEPKCSNSPLLYYKFSRGESTKRLSLICANYDSMNQSSDSMSQSSLLQVQQRQILISQKIFTPHQSVTSFE